MQLHLYTIKHNNNTLSIYSSTEKQYSSSWFMDFGKFGCEVFNKEENIIYKITKQFQFWKWKMVYTIKNNDEIITKLISQNNRKTVYSISINQITYELDIHFKKKISIYKNEIKIAEFDASFSDSDYKDTIKLLLLDKKDLEICFLLYSCLKIGETEQNQKAILTSQKQLEVNKEPWS
ncbi:hypothetical protein BW723_06795 [Polaribacter reichenbachii]|uniref:Tubby C-terminal domain-containing protein n=1 Tax=Polaribacter reichenbachii TaxID=996801 RepID=A0A1B8U5Y0_9FLAO|nr:hypothetical protein [Polaribacter reichenbachii]APZ46018.1 hypothetical protein BW723_06795 [Polaribacter reichenbachii]AUC19880.1 hypothetical protein BTO17_14815 [Polaribacter reichenbachii]OBY67265.1 hypothetical protein LPB301_02695 [Polaribacter reichenbachii]